MAENTFFQRLKKLKVDLRDMTWREKIDHVWSYYKVTILLTALLLIVVIGVGTTVLKPEKEQLMGGVCVNTYLSQEGESYVVGGYFDRLQGDPKKQETQLYFRSFGDFSVSVQDYDAFQGIIAMMSGEKVDYLLMNESSLMPFIGYESLMDLREIFTAEELEQFGTKIRYAQNTDNDGNPTGEMYPVAVEITDIPFIQDCQTYNQKTFLGFSVNSPNKQNLRDFWQYLLAWETKAKA